MRLHSRRPVPTSLVAVALIVGCHGSNPGTGESGAPQPDDTQIEQIPSVTWPTVLINEFMASNAVSVADGTGSHGDWIELYNPSDQRAVLTHWSITDDRDQPQKHGLEQLAIEPGGWLLLWADGDTGDGHDHLGFSLDAELGEDIALYTPDGTLVDGLSFGVQATDIAASRDGDGAERWVLTGEPTPGTSNGAGEAGTPGTWPEPPAACALGSDLEEVWYTEGDRIDFSVACSGELGTEQASLVPVNLPDGASFGDGAFAWQTDGASAARVDLSFAVTTAGAQGELPSAETVTFWVADDPHAAENNRPVDPLGYTEEWGLPVFHVMPSGTLSNDYVSTDLAFMGRSYPAFVKIRGATSSHYPKPGYMLEFGEAELEVEAWGVTRDHLALLSPFDDNGYVRQKLIYDLWADIAAFWGEERLTPRTFFAVVYMSGEYLGLFMALDRIDNEFLEHQGFDRDSNLYKAIDHDANFFLTDDEGNAKDSLHDGYEKKEGEPEDDYSDLEALVSFTGNASSQELVDGAEEWMDLQEFMDWYLLVYYSLSDDSAGKNAYLASAPGASYFRYTPWDFNFSWGQDWRTCRETPDTLTDYTGFNKVFQAIQEVESSDAELWERYRQMALAGGPFDPDWLTGRLDGYFAEIEPSAERDWARWGTEYERYESWSERRDSDDDWTDYQGEKQYLYDWLDARAVLFADRRE